jgi:hypothetical protein
LYLVEVQNLRDMKFISGTDRHQIALFPVSLDDSIDADNEVRFIDLFVDSLDLSSFGFKSDPLFKSFGIIHLDGYWHIQRT